ncbi:MAG: hypothetical protein H7Y42_18440 [Chitinophagaceae bacterium]|nr:hypothetical protein [Chitinophagaceae bacterium]
MRKLIFILILGFGGTVFSQNTHSIYADMPVGKYAVGFKIMTVIDDSRMLIPEYNYLGEKNDGDRRRKVTIHLWYPATSNTGKRVINFEDYCYNSLLTLTDGSIGATERAAQINRNRNSIEGWFGKNSEEDWNRLLKIQMLAWIDADPLKEQFPLLIGSLRPLSTTLTNEVLASNGYIVAMVKNDGGSFVESALRGIPDMQFAISQIGKSHTLNAKDIGVFGFSGSGFVPVLFGMYDTRVKALADIESGLYMEGLFQGLSASNYYTPAKLRASFLHMFSSDLSKQETHIKEYLEKAKFAKRYRLLLNQPQLHHWDFATEGYVSCKVLNKRGVEQSRIAQSFEISNIYLLRFFDAELKGDRAAQSFLATKPAIGSRPSSLWNIDILPAGRPAPNREEMEYIIRTKGIDQAMNILRSTVKYDSSSNILQGGNMNNLGYILLNEKKYPEAMEIFKFNVELHPEEPNFFDSLAEGYEAVGEKDKMKSTSTIVLHLLEKKTTLSELEKGLKANAESRLKK